MRVLVDGDIVRTIGSAPMIGLLDLGPHGDWAPRLTVEAGRDLGTRGWLTVLLDDRSIGSVRFNDDAPVFQGFFQAEDEFAVDIAAPTLESAIAAIVEGFAARPDR